MDQVGTGRDWRHALVLKADHADVIIREAALGFQERVLWRGSDATRATLERVSNAIRPLQRLIQTRLTWPLSDAMSHRSARTRAALAASTAALALAAGAAGAISAPDHHTVAPNTAAAGVAPLAVQTGAHTQVLQGVTPRFQPGHARSAPVQAPAKPSAPPAQVAWRFAQSFVGYEVGHAGRQADQAFAATATKPLAKALAADPPRLPAKAKVPQARVLNVVLGAKTKTQVTASVSLARLRAVSELRLTLTNSGDGWRVAQVLG
jgi:hypothetical protein